MVYKQNLHILLPADTYEELRNLGHQLRVSRAELARQAIGILLKKYNRKMQIPEVTCKE